MLVLSILAGVVSVDSGGVIFIFLLLSVFLYCCLPIPSLSGSRWGLGVEQAVLGGQSMEGIWVVKSEMWPDSGWFFMPGQVHSMSAVGPGRPKDGEMSRVEPSGELTLTSSKGQRAEGGPRLRSGQTEGGPSCQHRSTV